MSEQVRISAGFSVLATAAFALFSAPLPGAVERHDAAGAETIAPAPAGALVVSLVELAG
jgi:hypothetical protein